ncbi:MAG: hypothetical protein HKN43_04035 [Rhodothermales bacterium]|nr:hypothetical protein [Rhodothermales bacterium]
MPGQTPNWFVGFPVQGDSWCPVSANHVPGSIRLYHPDDLHITMAFLGSVSQRKALKAWKKVTNLKLEPVTISFNQLKPFGAFSTPSAYGLTLDTGRDSVANTISTHRRKILGAVGKKPRDGRVVPHVTIARPNRRLSKGDVYAIAEWRHEFEIPEVEVNLTEIALYTWAPPQAPQRFRKIETMQLK